MRAGLLKEFITFSELREIRSASGAMKREYAEVLRTRCCRKKLTAAYGNGLNASEEFIANTIILQARCNALINERQRITYQGKGYKIILLDKQPDNTYLITCSKENG